MKLSDKLILTHAELIQGRWEAAASHLCDLLELCRLNICYPDGDRSVMYTKLDSLVKASARNKPDVPEV